MPCGLPKAELKILKTLFYHRNFKPESAENINLMRSIHNKVFNTDFDGHIEHLIQEGYIGKTPKRAGEKIYLIDQNRVKPILSSHGISIPKGRIHQLD